MVTGRRAFEGKSQLSVASAILEKEPEPISAVKPASPAALEYVIRTCLAKDPEQRWQSARDLSHALRGVAAGGETAGAASAQAGGAGGRARGALLLAGLVVATATALILGWNSLTRVPARERVTRTSIKPMENSSFILSDGSGFALSPDGGMLAYVASTPEGKSALWVRPIASVRAQRLAGTEGAMYPFWSPDSRFIGFFAGAKLKKVEAGGGPPYTICDASDARGGAWGAGGEIVFTPSVNAALFRVSASGGSPAPVTTLDASKNELSHRWPWFLPDGRHFLFLAGSPFTPIEGPTNTINIGSLDSGDVIPLMNSHAGAIAVSGKILFLRQNTLMGVPFDERRLAITGDAAAIADQVQEGRIYARGLFSASGNGLLAYVEDTTSATRQFVWFDRTGKQTGAVPGADAYSSPRISTDGRQLVYYLDATGYDIWSYDMVRDVKTRQTFSTERASQSNIYPVWSPDGKSIAYSSYRNGKHYVMVKPADGSSSEETLLDGGERYRFPLDWSPDGKHLVYQEGTAAGFALMMLPLDGDRKPTTLLSSQFSHREGDFSPDGKWLAYTSNESGEYKIYVIPFPGPGGKWQVSPGGGFTPRWRGDGKEIFYYSSDSRIMAADVSASGSTFEVGSVHPLFETHAYGAFSRFDVTADGQRFIVPLEAGQQNTAITLVVNWPSDIRRTDP